ncbi:restriction endonuclease subunit S [Phocaeicola vulgatus]|uniref:Type I restriction endonuclease S subunit n=2 Tax=Phocaeicola vulgatus TaxID=821 RepID=A6L6I2_PHOV8|nr:restriction endonuclease subunit S [Phocaeicola vulgatus]ABR41296.1 type I restriction endonuclease S subunit [Phocaeicola vulgatus ATCC 8482]KAB5437034.1 restriction endonuclease subunit S [Phocaeicola vulgatus]
MAIDNKDKKVLNVPHLRFPEFSGEWENTELQYIAPNICSGKDKPTSNGTVALYGSTGIIGMTRLASYNEEIVLVARVGANAGQLQITTIPCGVTDNTLIINAKEWNRYIYYYLQHYNLNRLVFGSGQPLITGSMLKKLKIIYGEESERNKIVNLLCLLDERIATQNKIIEDLKKLKSAISERLFKSVKGSTVLLSDLCDIVKGKQINGENLSDSGNYYVMNGGTEPSGYYDNYNVEASTISISEGGNSCGYVQFNTSPFWSGGHCYSIQNIADKVDNMYLYHYLKSNEDAIMKLRIGSGLPNIQKKDLAMFKIIVPKIEWQIKISTFLSSLERKAEIEERIQNVMQKQKLYLLQQMFI